MIDNIEVALTRIAKTKPVVLCLTNYVTMDFVANCLLALGAAPIMSVYDLELEELVKISSAVYINIGTLDENFILRCKMAAELAVANRKPIILDPVGAGATLTRVKLCKDLLKYVDVIKGNASEIMSLSRHDIKTLGVETSHTTQDAKNISQDLARNLKTTIVVTGAEDFITNGDKSESLTCGSPLMSKVTGMGCALGAVIAAFRSITHDTFESAVLAAYYFGCCGNIAALKASEPGTFRALFIDAIYNADIKMLNNLHILS